MLLQPLQREIDILTGCVTGYCSIRTARLKIINVVLVLYLGKRLKILGLTPYPLRNKPSLESQGFCSFQACLVY